jgi:hypothetical protein
MVLGDPMQLSAPEAAAKAQRPIYLPNMVPGEDQTPEAWYSNVTGQIDIRYGDVLVLVFESWAAGQDPAKAYAREAKDWGGNSTEIGGHPAWVVEAKDDSGIPMIHVTIDSWDIALYGRMSEDQLGSIAANLQRVESSN